MMKLQIPATHCPHCPHCPHCLGTLVFAVVLVVGVSGICCIGGLGVNRCVPIITPVKNILVLVFDLVGNRIAGVAGVNVVSPKGNPEGMDIFVVSVRLVLVP
jgi:hypothetical protein